MDIQYIVIVTIWCIISIPVGIFIGKFIKAGRA